MLHRKLGLQALIDQGIVAELCESESGKCAFSTRAVICIGLGCGARLKIGRKSVAHARNKQTYRSLRYDLRIDQYNIRIGGKEQIPVKEDVYKRQAL